MPLPRRQGQAQGQRRLDLVPADEDAARVIDEPGAGDVEGAGSGRFGDRGDRRQVGRVHLLEIEVDVDVLCPVVGQSVGDEEERRVRPDDDQVALADLSPM